MGEPQFFDFFTYLKVFPSSLGNYMFCNLTNYCERIYYRVWMYVHTVCEAVICLSRHLKSRSSTTGTPPFIRGLIGLTFRGFFPRQSEHFCSFILSCTINISAPVHNNRLQIKFIYLYFHSMNSVLIFILANSLY